jgi:hypothetical protein
MSVFKRVLAAHEYETREGKKTSWKEVGIITQNDKGNMFLSLHHLPNQNSTYLIPIHLGRHVKQILKNSQGTRLMT